MTAAQVLDQVARELGADGVRVVMDKAPGAVAVLGMNVLMMSVGAASALLAQRAIQRRAASRASE